MNYSNKFSELLPNLALEASKSPIRYNLAAGIIKGGRMIRAPTHNTNATVVRGCRCSSLHAETRAILQVYPNLTYSKAKGWCFFPSKRKGSRFKKGQQEKVKI